ncbi:TIGR00730 family Rossman fold protein [soil metagenome]
MKSICVFCASSLGEREDYQLAAEALGHTLGRLNIRLIYGGAKVGLMGAVADAVLQSGGAVTGVLPHFLSGKEIAHTGLNELILVESMHERKLQMSKLADGFIALPGGYGTLEELLEIITWAQLGLHHKPIAVLNINGYYNHLIQLLDHMAAEGLLKERHRRMMLFTDKVEDVINVMLHYSPPVVNPLMDKLSKT